MKGRLAQLLTEGTSPNPRWLIKFDGVSHKDEEMYERSFGKLIASADDDDEPVSNRSRSPPTTNQNKSSTRLGDNRKGSKSASSSSDDEPKKAKASGATKTAKPKDSNDGSDGDSSSPETSGGRKMSAKDRVSAREARSRRRQAQIDQDVPPGLVDPAGGQRRAPQPSNPKKRQRGNDGDVVKVKLLTGTLFIYKGLNRRAEFIRRV